MYITTSVYTFYSRCASLLSSSSSSPLPTSLLLNDVVKREREGKLATEYHKSGCLFRRETLNQGGKWNETRRCDKTLVIKYR